MRKVFALLLMPVIALGSGRQGSPTVDYAAELDWVESHYAKLDHHVQSIIKSYQEGHTYTLTDADLVDSATLYARAYKLDEHYFRAFVHAYVGSPSDVAAGYRTARRINAIQGYAQAFLAVRLDTSDRESAALDIVSYEEILKRE